MKFYNLTFDCNTPTKQQVNIPTNTDYKVGIKIVRNGKQSILSPSEIMLDTLSADAEKTNGYVTFTEAAGDSPSFVEKKVTINKGYDYNDTIASEGGPAVAGENANFLSASVEDYGLGGLEMSLDSGFQWGYNTSLNSPGSVSDITNWKDMKTTTSGANVVMFIWPNGREAASYRPSVQKFATFDSDGSNAKWVDKFTIDPTWCLGGGNTGIGWRAQANKYWVAAFKFQLGQPYTASFKLNENIYKSQQGDIGVSGGSSGSSINISGEYSDGTDFSFDALTK